MERFLDAYIERLRPYFTGFAGKNAHAAASAFLAFKYGLYANAIRECSHAIALVPDGDAGSALKKALEIIRANARIRDSSQVTADPGIGFSAAEQQYLAISLPADRIDDAGTLNLDNALVLTYVASLIASPEDEEALGEHRRLIVRMLSDYKKALGLG